jgi:hypothetical protein
MPIPIYKNNASFEIDGKYFGKFLFINGIGVFCGSYAAIEGGAEIKNSQ